jgi:hypothetical protein
MDHAKKRARAFGWIVGPVAKPLMAGGVAAPERFAAWPVQSTANRAGRAALIFLFNLSTISSWVFLDEQTARHPTLHRFATIDSQSAPNPEAGRELDTRHGPYTRL